MHRFVHYGALVTQVANQSWFFCQPHPCRRGRGSVDIKLIAPQPKLHNKILFIGKDFKRKAGYITYDAFKLLRGQGEKVELFVIGPTQNPIGIPVDGYHFIGQIPFSEEAKYYNMCDVFCLPSYFESYVLYLLRLSPLTCHV